MSAADLREIAIAGCGPAGLTAALLLARQGRRVRLFDQYDAPQPVGSGLMLQPVGMAVLAALGLAPRMRRLGRRIDRLYGRAAPSGRVVLDVRYAASGDPGRHGLAVHRSALFGVLEDAARAAKIPVETDARLVDLARGPGDRPVLIDARGRRFGPFDLLIDATGARSALRAAAGLGVPARPLRYGALWATVPWRPEIARPFAGDALEQRYVGAARMVGVLPVGRRREDTPELATFFWSLKPESYDAWRAEGMDAWSAEARALWPETGPILDTLTDPDQLTLARYAHFTLSRPIASRIALIGDAAHAASPQLGQGANMALLDAFALAEALRAEPTLELALSAYAATRRWHVRAYQLMSRLFTPLYQSDSLSLPWLRDRLIAPVAAIPPVPRLLAAIVAGTMVDPYAGGPAPKEVDGRETERVGADVATR